MEPRKILTRHENNPLIDPADYPGIISAFNPSPFELNGKICLLVSTTNTNKENNFRETFLAESTDGIHFTLSGTPLVDRSSIKDPVVKALGGIIDNRITKIDDFYYFVSPQGTWEVGHQGCVSVLYKTRDFIDIEFVEVISLPWQRGCSLFPGKINGKYYRLDRPGEGAMKSGIWISSSPDLIHWGCHRPLLSPGYAIWNGLKIGPTPPIEVDEGWLVITHGMDIPDNSMHYYIGALLLDKENPQHILGKTNSYLLAAEKDYEMFGHVNHVVFPTGAIIKAESDEILIYYGAADTRVCLASGSLSRVIEACKKEL
ncbi:MAG: hypothetical protein JXR86_18980 [Spirochaetales bacterium]|nr:hypothetical protein [Spirochaetales bacterium]